MSSDILFSPSHHQSQQSPAPPTLHQFQQMQQSYETTLEHMRTEAAAAAKTHAALLASMQHQPEIDQLTAASNASAAFLASSKPPASESGYTLRELKQDIANLQKDRSSSSHGKSSPYETPRANRSLFDTLFKDSVDNVFGLKTSNTQTQSSSSNLSTKDLSKSTVASSSSLPVPSSSFVQSATAPTLHRIEYKFMTRFVSAVKQYYGKGGHLHIHTMLSETVQDQLRDLWSLLHQTNPSTIVSHSEWQSHNPQILPQQEQMMAQFITFITTHFAVQCSLHTSGKPAPQITSIKSLNNVIHEFYEIKSTLHLTGQKDPVINDYLLNHLYPNNKAWMNTFYSHLQRHHNIARPEVRNQQFTVLLEAIKSFFGIYITTVPDNYSHSTSTDSRKDRYQSTRGNDNRHSGSSKHSHSKRYRRDRSNSQSRHGRNDHHHRDRHHRNSSNYRSRHHNDYQGHYKSVNFPRHPSEPPQHFGYRDSSMSDNGSVRSGGSQYSSRSGYSSHSSASRNSHQSQTNASSANANANNPAPAPKPSSSSSRHSSSGSHSKRKP